jgi:hypothetical protein
LEVKTKLGEEKMEERKAERIAKRSKTIRAANWAVRALFIRLMQAGKRMT